MELSERTKKYLETAMADKEAAAEVAALIADMAAKIADLQAQIDAL